jgi:uncharacterized SAM-binding protein YcdF (DUF218 family)
MRASASRTSSAGPLRSRLSRPGWFGRRWRVLTIILIVVTVAFGTATARLLVWPERGMPARVSAIVMLAGPGDRLPVAVRLAQEHRAPVLVVSRGWQGYAGPCPARIPGVKLVCFDANPGDTRGEAEFIGRLAKRDHWTSIVLVATRPQDTRARILVGRCFSGSIYVVTAPLPLRSWPYELAYGWGALIKALTVKQSC